MLFISGCGSPYKCVSTNPYPIAILAYPFFFTGAFFGGFTANRPVTA